MPSNSKSGGAKVPPAPPSVPPLFTQSWPLFAQVALTAAFVMFSSAQFTAQSLKVTS